MSKSTGRFFQNFEAFLKKQNFIKLIGKSSKLYQACVHMGMFSEKATKIWENLPVELTLREGHKIWKNLPLVLTFTQ